MKSMKKKSTLDQKIPTQIELLKGRFDGSKERLEVWYDTFTDEKLKAGFWIHHEMVSPEDAKPYVHGWLAYFFNSEIFTDDENTISVGFERFGPVEFESSEFFECGEVKVAPNIRRGKTDNLSWDLKTDEFTDPPIYTFTKLAWDKEILPSCQIVAGPNLTYNGTITVMNKEFEISNAKGALARIYGHGNAKKWAWLHLDLGGKDMLEIVTAVSTKPGLDRLKPFAFVQLRYNNEDWPSNPLTAFPFFKTKLSKKQDNNYWSVSGKFGDYRIEVKVKLDKEKCVEVEYTDPDGKKAVCVNTEIGDAEVFLEKKVSNKWVEEKRWIISNRAHCEMGFR